MTRIALLTGCAAMLLWVTGCGGPKMRDISGRVTLDGNPVESGDLILRPTEPGVQAIRAQIVNGQYQVRCPLGRNQVEITAYRDTNQPDGFGGTVREQYIPSRYNDDSTLELDVPASGDATFDFPLESA